MTAVIEQNATIEAGDFFTEPYETAWASEARWFVYCESTDLDMRATVTIEISPEGLTWCPLPGAESLILGDDLLETIACREFGGWLRLRAHVEGDGAFRGVRIYLALKG
jgi:hypothetical protein